MGLLHIRSSLYEALNWKSISTISQEKRATANPTECLTKKLKPLPSRLKLPN